MDPTELPLDLILLHFIAPLLFDRVNIKELGQLAVSTWFDGVTTLLGLKQYLLIPVPPARAAAPAPVQAVAAPVPAIAVAAPVVPRLQTTTAVPLSPITVQPLTPPATAAPITTVAAADTDSKTAAASDEKQSAAVVTTPVATAVSPKPSASGIEITPVAPAVPAAIVVAPAPLVVPVAPVAAVVAVPAPAVVAPEEYITHFSLRVFSLLMLVWCTHLLLSYLALVVPLLTGRAILTRVRSSLRFHDMYSWFGGFYLQFMAVYIVVRVVRFLKRAAAPPPPPAVIPVPAVIAAPAPLVVGAAPQPVPVGAPAVAAGGAVAAPATAPSPLAFLAKPEFWSVIWNQTVRYVSLGATCVILFITAGLILPLLTGILFELTVLMPLTFHSGELSLHRQNYTYLYQLMGVGALLLKVWSRLLLNGYFGAEHPWKLALERAIRDGWANIQLIPNLRDLVIPVGWQLISLLAIPYLFAAFVAAPALGVAGIDAHARQEQDAWILSAVGAVTNSAPTATVESTTAVAAAASAAAVAAVAGVAAPGFSGSDASIAHVSAVTANSIREIEARYSSASPIPADASAVTGTAVSLEPAASESLPPPPAAAAVPTATTAPASAVPFPPRSTKPLVLWSIVLWVQYHVRLIRTELYTSVLYRHAFLVFFVMRCMGWALVALRSAYASLQRRFVDDRFLVRKQLLNAAPPTSDVVAPPPAAPATAGKTPPTPVVAPAPTSSESVMLPLCSPTSAISAGSPPRIGGDGGGDVKIEPRFEPLPPATATRDALPVPLSVPLPVPVLPVPSQPVPGL